MSPTENIHFEELVSSYLDASLSPEQEFELLQLLESPAYGQAFLEMTRINSEIKGLLAQPVSDDVMVDVIKKEIAYSTGQRSARHSRVYQAVMETIEVHAPRSAGSIRPGSARFIAQRPIEKGAIEHRIPAENELLRPSLRITKPTTPWAMAISIAFHAALIVLILGIQFTARLQSGPAISPNEKLLAQAPVPTNLPSARIEAVSGEAIAVENSQRKLAELGSSIKDGESLETVGLKSTAGIKYPDGSLLVLNPDTKVSQLTGTGIEGTIAAAKRFYVERGVVSANVFKQPAGRPMTILTSNAEATVIGTRFSLLVAPGETRLDVTEGVVRLTRLGDKRFVDVRAGEYAVVANGVDLAVKSLNPRRTFIMGVNFYGTAVTIEDNRWLSHQDALTRGLNVKNFDAKTNSHVVNFAPIPPVDADMRAMLNSRVYSMAKDMEFKLPLPNGDYEVALYVFEPHRNGSRVFDVEFNGVLAKRGVGRLKAAEWEKATLRGTVKDGLLHLHMIQTYGNPAISGMAIYKLD